MRLITAAPSSAVGETRQVPRRGRSRLARASFALLRPLAPGCPSGGRALDVATLDLEPGPGEAAEIGGGLVLRDEPFVASSLDLRPGVQALGGQAARREEELLMCRVPRPIRSYVYALVPFQASQ